MGAGRWRFWCCWAGTVSLCAPIVTGYLVEATGSFDSAFMAAGALALVGATAALTLSRGPRNEGRREACTRGLARLSSTESCAEFRTDFAILSLAKGGTHSSAARAAGRMAPTFCRGGTSRISGERSGDFFSAGNGRLRAGFVNCLSTPRESRSKGAYAGTGASHPAAPLAGGAEVEGGGRRLGPG